jgi:hypothetical protein
MSLKIIALATNVQWKLATLQPTSNLLIAAASLAFTVLYLELFIC